MTATTEINQQETRTASKEVRKIQFRTMSSSFEEEYCSGDESTGSESYSYSERDSSMGFSESSTGLSERSSGSGIIPTSVKKQSSSGSRGVGFNLDANTVHHHSDCPKHKKKTKEHWYSPSEVDEFRDHFNRGVARQSSRKEENLRKEAMSKSKAIVIYNQKNLCPVQLAEMYKEHSERSQDQANRMASDHQDEVKEIHLKAPKKKSGMKKLLKRLSTLSG